MQAKICILLLVDLFFFFFFAYYFFHNVKTRLKIRNERIEMGEKKSNCQQKFN